VNHQILWSEANAAPSTSGYLVDSAYHVSDNQPSTTQNYLAEHQATVALVTERKADFNPHSQMNTVALKDTELLPNQHVAGATWFQREGKRETWFSAYRSGCGLPIPLRLLRREKVTTRFTQPNPARKCPDAPSNRGIFLFGRTRLQLSQKSRSHRFRKVSAHV